MFGIFYWKDIMEVLFFSSIIYYFSIWLKKDKKSNLLISFYSYCAIFLIASLVHLPTITAFLFYTSPLVFMLFIIVHQEIVQRNFVTLRKSVIQNNTELSDWLENLIRATLHAMNNKKQLICIIEHRSQLAPFIKAPFLFNSPIDQQLLTLLIDSDGYDQQRMIWCTTGGTLISINASWNILHDELWKTEHVKGCESWQQDALLMTNKTDAIIFKANALQRTFDVIAQGTLYEAVYPHHVLPLIKKQLSGSSVSKGDYKYDYDNQKRTIEQRTT
jgi:hypothetical protein